MNFTLTHQSATSKARTGLIQTDHGKIETPVFMPVGTRGTVKGISQEELKEMGASIILGNTYHLYLRPGLEVMESARGLHRFMNWEGPILTDSGGYQIYSLSSRRKIEENGVAFSSHIDGSKHFFTPEGVVGIQRKIGADIIMAFDECTPYPCDKPYAKKSMDLTHRWLKRCVDEFDSTVPLYGAKQILVPIVQGSVYSDLRRESARVISEMNAPINAIGGLSVGEPSEIIYEMIAIVNEVLSLEKPRYLMGVGTPIDILEAISEGVDMFDCVLPTRNARHGLIYTSEGVVNIKNKKWRGSAEAIDPGSPNLASQHYSKGYLRHLIRTNEMLGARLATMQNLTFYLDMMNTARIKIQDNSFDHWKEDMAQIANRRL
ncbi:MAG: tRNA guanosine(34) transglycosylase Tgt [Saprospiraceae bacterium]|nr:tRNA guanosine(34) transglycosylase Tgt [Saprospiraceae bacterium]